MPVQDVEARIDSINPVYPVVNGNPALEVSTGTFDAAAVISCGGITQPPDGDYPEGGDNLDVRIGDEQLYTGTVDESGRDGENLVRMTSFTRERQLHQKTLTRNFENATPGEVIRAGFEEAGIIPFSEAYPTGEDVREATESQFAEEQLEEERTGEESLLTIDFDSTPCVIVVQTAALAAQWDWKLTADGRGWYGNPGLANIVANDPDTGEPDDLEESLARQATPTTHNLRWVLSDGTSPQFQEMGFDTIRVVGSPRRTETDGAVVVENDPIVAEIDVFEGGSDDSQKRVHLYVDDRITTQAMANNTARKMWINVRRQRSKGTIRVVGDTRLRPLDSCRMLPELSASENGDFYHINSVTHLIDSQGFFTDVNVSGYVDFSDTPDVDTDPPPLSDEDITSSNQ